MIEYPKTDLEFEETFKTEEDCLEYLFSVRWPNGLLCPKCRHDKLWRNDRARVLECSSCGSRMRPLVGTIFQDTRLPMKIWFKAMWHIMSRKYGANATGLARVLDIAHSSAWNILHKLRRSMVRAERSKLGPLVEADEAFIGVLEEEKPGRGAEKKSRIAVAAEFSEKSKYLGRIRLEAIPDAGSSSLIPFILKNVVPQSKVVNDGWAGYLPLSKEDFTHDNKSVKKDDGMLPRAHLVISLLKRRMLGTFQGSISRKYLEYYLDEFVFRFNRRKSKSRGKLFRRLVEQAVITPPVTREEIKAKAPEAPLSIPGPSVVDTSRQQILCQSRINLKRKIF
jgi:transposase-like protein/Zn ribbon nucleic-acid-binding protein